MMMSHFPSCGWRGGVCTYRGPWQFVLEMALVLLIAAALVWLVRIALDDDDPESGEEVESQPRRYRFDDAHMDRIVRDDEERKRE